MESKKILEENSNEKINHKSICKSKRRNCNYLSVFPIILITIGLILLVDNLNIINNAFSKLWPLILIIIGIVKIVQSFYE